MVLVLVALVLLYTPVHSPRVVAFNTDGSKKNGAGGGGGVLERYDVTNRIEYDSKADDKGGSRAYPSRTTFGQRWEVCQKHGISTEPLKLFGFPISDMLYYINWRLTKAQVELLAADVSVVDYDYDTKKKKKKRGEFDNTHADAKEVKKAGDEWLKKYGDKENAGKGLSAADILGGGFKSDVGIKID